MTFVRTCVHSTWQMRRSLKILDGAADETIDDLFSTMSEVEKMGRMEQTLLRMLSVIGARKTVVEEREAARLAEAAAPAGQSNISAFFQAPTPPVQVTSISEDAMAEVETPAPKKRGRPKGKATNKGLRDGARTPTSCKSARPLAK